MDQESYFNLKQNQEIPTENKKETTDFHHHIIYFHMTVAWMPTD